MRNGTLLCVASSLRPGTSISPVQYESVVLRNQDIIRKRNAPHQSNTMNWNHLHLLSRVWVEHSFKRLVSRKIRERDREERRFAEQRITKHRFQAIKSCVVDARNYRVARKVSSLSMAHFD
jgi:hypothetical protein